MHFESEPSFFVALTGLRPMSPPTGGVLRKLEEDSRETRIGLSAAARKAAETLAKMPGSKVIKHAQAHRHVTASSSVLHGWDAKEQAGSFSLNVLSLGDLNVKIGQNE